MPGIGRELGAEGGVEAGGASRRARRRRASGRSRGEDLAGGGEAAAEEAVVRRRPGRGSRPAPARVASRSRIAIGSLSTSTPSQSKMTRRAAAVMAVRRNSRLGPERQIAHGVSQTARVFRVCFACVWNAYGMRTGKTWDSGGPGLCRGRSHAAAEVAAQRGGGAVGPERAQPAGEGVAEGRRVGGARRRCRACRARRRGRPSRPRACGLQAVPVRVVGLDGLRRSRWCPSQ